MYEQECWLSQTDCASAYAVDFGTDAIDTSQPSVVDNTVSHTWRDAHNIGIFMYTHLYLFSDQEWTVEMLECCSVNLEWRDHQTVKVFCCYIQPFWHSNGVYWTERQTNRQTKLLWQSISRFVYHCVRACGKNFAISANKSLYLRND